MPISIFISGVSPKFGIANLISMSVFFVFMFLSGMFIPLSGAPDFIILVSRVLPITCLVNLMHGLISPAQFPVEIVPSLVLLLGWGIGFTVLSLITYKFE